MPAPSVPLLALEPVVRTSAGSAVGLDVSLTNTDSVPRRFHLHALGLDPQWMPPALPTPILAPGQSHTATLRLTPPAGTVPAKYPFVVSAQGVDAAGAAAGGSALAESTLLVNPRTQLRLELTPASLTLWRSRRVRLTLTNLGAGTCSVRLNPQTSGSIRFRLSKTRVEVGPGARITVPGRVTLSHPRLAGFGMRHRIQVEATGSETTRYAEGEVVQRALIPPIWLKFVAVAAALAIWVSAGMVLIPRITDLVNGNDSATLAGPGGGSGTDGGAGSKGDGASGGGSGGRATSVAFTTPGKQLNGTISADAPSGVNVALRRTSLVDEEALGATPLGISAASYTSSAGKLRPAAATTSSTRSAQTATTRQVRTRADGVWAFPGVASPGYYLLTFSKVGYQAQSFVVDAASEAANEPLDVDLRPGDGSITGTVTAAGTMLGGATVTVSDGTTTTSTTTPDTGKVGRFSVGNLATPGTYVVTATRDGLSLESTVVRLKASGSATARLALRAGVATLTGQITDGSAPIGSATVSVLDTAGHAYTATTETGADGTGAAGQGTAGHYSVPGLPAPGSYRIAVSADGYQPLVGSLTLRSGDSSRVSDLQLRSSTGSVIGQVTDDATPAVGLPDAGLVLRNDEHVYKQTSTTASGSGTAIAGYIEFSGVAPGTYQLSTELWGYTSATATVDVAAGEITRVSPALTFNPISELAARGRIKGKVLDANTREPIACRGGVATCLSAQTVDPCPIEQPTCARDGSDADSYSVAFGPAEEFILPAEPAGLRPGLHTVTLSAPGYESATTRVAVPGSGAVTMTTPMLYPAPVVSGTITTADGSTPPGGSCVFATKTGSTAPTNCQQAIDAGTCTATPVLYGGGSDSAVPCAITDANGDYSIQVSGHGGWTLYVATKVDYYVASGALALQLPKGGQVKQDVTLNRLGRATISVKVPGSGGIAVAAGAGSPVTVLNSDAVVVLSTLTDDAGRATVSGLPSGTYTIRATDVNDSGLTGSIPLTFQYNAHYPVSLVLRKGLTSLWGRVTTTLVTGEVQPVAAATVKVIAPFDYDANDAPASEEVTFSTGTGGCFAGLKGASTMTDAAIALALPVPSQCHPQSTWTATPRSVSAIRFVSPNATKISLSAPGLDPTTSTDVPWTATPNPLSMTAQRRTWTGLTLTLPSGVNAVPPSLSISVQGDPLDGRPKVAMPGIVVTPGTVAAGSVPLTWKDGTAAANSFAPGTYLLTARAPGYDTSTATLTCAVNGTCALTATWSLVRLGSITVTTTAGTSSGGSPIQGAEVSVRPCADALCSTYAGDAYTGTTGGGGKVTITGSLDRRGLITDGYELADRGVQWFEVRASAGTFQDADRQIVTLNEPGDHATAALTMTYRPAAVEVILTDQAGQPVPFATLELVGPTTVDLTADPHVPGRYTSRSVPPATYTIKVTAEALMISNVGGFPVEPGATSVRYEYSVARGASRVAGVVTSEYVAPGQTTGTPIAEATITLTCDPDTPAYDTSLCPADGPAKGTDGALLETETAADGSYHFSNVPNGTYHVTASLDGWATLRSAPLLARWSFAPPAAQNFALALITQKVTVALEPTMPQASMNGFKVTLTPSSTAYGRRTLADFALAADGRITISDVPFGCYTLSFTKPENHFGTTAFRAQSAGVDTTVTCPELGVSGRASTASENHAATVAYRLAESSTSITVTAGTHWHQAPAAASIRLSPSSGAPLAPLTVPLGTAETVWLPPGGWTVSASAEPGSTYSYPSAFWPASTESFTVSSGSAAPDQALTLNERRSDVTLTVPGDIPGVSITVAPTGTDLPTLSPADLTGLTDSDGRLTLALPGGSYDVEVTPPTGYLTPATQTFTVTTHQDTSVPLDALVRTTAEVTVSLSDPDGTALTGWTASLTRGTGTPGPTPAAQSLSAAGTATFTVPWGCWTVTLVAPGAETRTATFSSSSGGGGCAGGVAIAAGASAVSVAYTLPATPEPDPEPTP